MRVQVAKPCEVLSFNEQSRFLLSRRTKVAFSEGQCGYGAKKRGDADNGAANVGDLTSHGSSDDAGAR